MSGAQIQQLFDAAERAQQAGLADEARGHFHAIVALDAQEPTARNWLGVEALSNGDADAAADHFEQAAARDAGERSHWINLATAQRMRGEIEAERSALERALTLDQRDLLALIRLAELHEREQEDAPATERWSSVLALSSGIADPTDEFAAVLAHARQFVGARKQRLDGAVDSALADDLARASERDRRRMERAADHWLGRRAIFTNQCEGLHYPFLPADEFFDRALFPWLSDLEAATEIIQTELAAILADPAAALTPYITLPPGVPESKWSPLDQSLNWGAFHLWKEGVRFDEACARAPRTAALVEALPLCHIEGRAPNIFFSILKAGGHIPAHFGVTNVRSVVHLPLIVPGDCTFRVGGETRAWVAGEAFAFDDTIEHEAWNRSDRDRAVLIIDAWNPHLGEHERAMVNRLYAAADAART
ncbi:MAG: aspartyl/asparaginyl beta-hydroxylase domain-containing protein [Sphingomicrobium sp.]